MKKHFTVKIIGQVQGVLFRYAAKEKADELGIQGFVRNESDGSVYVEVEGEERVLNEFFKWCEQGPKFASVEKIETKERTPGHYSDFVIK